MQSIMIVDDEALVLFDMVMTVEDLGYEVFCDSISVPDALDCLGDGCPDAALLDIDVGGTLVWPLARVLAERGCPIIFVSANRAHEELQNEFAECGFIDKPASTSQIQRALAKAVSSDPEQPRMVAGG
ncbi:response regulator [Qipengyuania sp. 1NDH17]|uniref:Response regulator n=1 Tax=Qipengyuania polymorpha TaxID=2867234 RepID=A0ABS7J1D9_9SPHN|nr:response regulator [Qipengyuania polymorpha]MBX7457884.1 response regulator [Qipengyuania polymorpha]